jgi:hypothetical protein
MDNQHKLIKGYRDLSQEEIDLMNEIKTCAERVKQLVAKVWDAAPEVDDDSDGNEFHPSDAAVEHQRWCWMGRDQLQQGFMALIRAVAKPQSF